MNTTVFKRKKLLTRPTLQFKEGITQYVKIEGPIFIGKEIKSNRGRPSNEPETKKREPAHVANVLDLQNGYEPSQIIISAVVLGVFNDEYPDNAYVGKCFAITKLAKKEGKDYFGYKVEEIEDPQGETTPPDKKSDEVPGAPARPVGGKR